MKSLVWFNSALHQSGGGERLSLEVVRCLKESGYDANYVVYFYDSMATFEGQYDFLKPISMNEVPIQAKGRVIHLIRRFRRLWWLRKTLMGLTPDCVITSGTWNQVVDLYLATLFTGIPFVTHVFGSMFAFKPDLEKLKFGKVFSKNFMQVRNSMKSYQDVVPERLPVGGFFASIRLNFSAYVKYRAIRVSKALFVLSERNRWENNMLYGKDSVVLQGAFPARIFDYIPSRSLKRDLGLTNKKVILSISRLVPNKRVDLVIRSFAEIVKRSSDSFLVIGGSGPEAENLERLAAELQVSDNVRFIGYVSEAILWDYFSNCDAFLHLDLADFDIAPLEALAMGANVIWGNEMNLPDLTQKLTGLWAVPPEPVAISNATLQAIDARNETMPMGARRDILQTYTWESYTARMTHAMEVAIHVKG